MSNEGNDNANVLAKGGKLKKSNTKSMEEVDDSDVKVTLNSSSDNAAGADGSGVPVAWSVTSPPPKVVPRDIPSIITQTDAQGRPIPIKVPDSSATDDSIPPPYPNDPKPNSSCSSSLLSCMLKYICCLNYAEMYEQRYPPLLSVQAPHRKGKKCLVLDLDETLVHSSFEMIPQVDFTISISLEGKKFEIYVVKRPGVDEFLKELGKHYEIVLFTASVPKYALKVMEILDVEHVVDALLFRESCTLYEGNFVKDLSRLGRNLKQCILVDNSPLSYQFQPDNAIGVTTFLTDKSDRELFYLKEFLIAIKDEEDVREKLKTYSDFITDKIKQEFVIQSHDGRGGEDDVNI